MAFKRGNEPYLLTLLLLLSNKKAKSVTRAIHDWYLEMVAMQPSGSIFTRAVP